jgi:hypothetical protein
VRVEGFEWNGGLKTRGSRRRGGLDGRQAQTNDASGFQALSEGRLTYVCRREGGYKDAVREEEEVEWLFHCELGGGLLLQK